MADVVVDGVLGLHGVREVALVQDALLVGMDDVGAITPYDEAVRLDVILFKLLDVLVVHLVNPAHLSGQPVDRDIGCDDGIHLTLLVEERS